ncbi:hypothetical protein PO909_020766 [Leuciscus waleckii]
MQEQRRHHCCGSGEISQSNKAPAGAEETSLLWQRRNKPEKQSSCGNRGDNTAAAVEKFSQRNRALAKTEETLLLCSFFIMEKISHRNRAIAGTEETSLLRQWRNKLEKQSYCGNRGDITAVAVEKISHRNRAPARAEETSLLWQWRNKPEKQSSWGNRGDITAVAVEK